MKNPWIRKNPALSMWLSGANAIAGSARRRAKRQAVAMITKGAKQMAGLWTGAPVSPQKKKRR